MFQEVCYARDMREMIADRYLCPITGWRVDTDLSLGVTEGPTWRFYRKPAAHVVNTPLRNSLLVNASYRDFAGKTYHRVLRGCGTRS